MHFNKLLHLVLLSVFMLHFVKSRHFSPFQDVTHQQDKTPPRVQFIVIHSIIAGNHRAFDVHYGDGE